MKIFLMKMKKPVINDFFEHPLERSGGVAVAELLRAGIPFTQIY